jgi:hypothetical protein
MHTVLTAPVGLAASQHAANAVQPAPSGGQVGKAASVVGCDALDAGDTCGAGVDAALDALARPFRVSSRGRPSG